MELRKLTDVALENNLVSLVAKERSLLCVIILHVMEIERRKKYLNSHPNLFSYLCEKLKYSHGSAQRRIDAALLAVEVPSVLKDVQSGELNLTQITTAQVAFRLATKTHKAKITAEVKQKVLEEIKSKSVAESEVILYSKLNIKPKSRVRIKHQADESVHIEMTLTKEQWAKLQRTKELLSHSVPTGNLTDLIEYFTDRVIAQKDKTLPKNSLARKSAGIPKKEHRINPSVASSPLPDGKSEIETTFTTDAEKGETQIPIGKSQNERVNEEIPNGKSESARVNKKIPIGKSVSERRDQKIPIGKSDPPTPNHSGRFFAPSKRKAIKISIQRAVFARDKYCQHKDPAAGKICGSKWSLQLDHIQPVWAGGDETMDNLQLLCGVHNRRRYKVQAGFVG